MRNLLVLPVRGRCFLGTHLPSQNTQRLQLLHPPPALPGQRWRLHILPPKRQGAHGPSLLFADAMLLIHRLALFQLSAETSLARQVWLWSIYSPLTAKVLAVAGPHPWTKFASWALTTTAENRAFCLFAQSASSTFFFQRNGRFIPKQKWPHQAHHQLLVQSLMTQWTQTLIRNKLFYHD